MFYCILLKYAHMFCCILLLVNTSRFITHIFQDNFGRTEAISTVSIKQFCLICVNKSNEPHYADVIMSAMPSETTEVSMVCSTVCSGADQRKHQRSASLACVCVCVCVWGGGGGSTAPVIGGFPHKGPVTRKIFSFDDVIHAVRAIIKQHEI